MCHASVKENPDSSHYIRSSSCRSVSLSPLFPSCSKFSHCSLLTVHPLHLKFCFLSFLSGHQQPLQFSEGCSSAASGSRGQETGPLPGVRSCSAGPAGVCLWAGGSLARLHLVNRVFFLLFKQC